MNKLYNFHFNSISHHFEPDFFVTLILDSANYLLVLGIFFFLFKSNKITENLFILIVFLLATPFLFNGFLFDWSYFPDQSKYVNLSKQLRAEIFTNSSCTDFISQKYSCNRTLKTSGISYFYAISPIISFETYKSLAFWNRGLFLLMLVYFLNKKVIKDELLLLLLFLPSIIMFTSLSLRETPIIVLMLLYIYFFYNNKYLLSFTCVVFLAILKVQNILILIFASFVISIFGNNKKKLVLVIISFIIITPLIFYFMEDILWWINKYRKGLFVEEFGNYKSISSLQLYDNYSRLSLDINSLKLILLGFFEFLISPARDLTSGFKILLAIENILLYLFITQKFLNAFKKDKKMFYIWIVILTFGLLMYSIFVFNDAQIHRYKTPIIIFVMFGLNLSLQKKTQI